MESIQGNVENNGKNTDRFDQSPLPNYPNFEPVNKGFNQKLAIGDVGWGVDKPNLTSSPLSLSDNRANHVCFFDKTKD